MGFLKQITRSNGQILEPISNIQNWNVVTFWYTSGKFSSNGIKARRDVTVKRTGICRACRVNKLDSKVEDAPTYISNQQCEPARRISTD